MIRSLILIIALTFALFPALSQENDVKAIYLQGDYRQSASLLEKMASQNGVSSALYYDLGNSFMRSGNLGGATLNYQRALLLDPSNKKASNNLLYLKARIEDANNAEAKGKNVSVGEEDSSFFTSVKEYICYSHRSDTWAAWAAVCFCLGCICAALYLFRPEVGIRKIGFFGGGVMLGICLITLIFAFMNANARSNPDRGVILSYKTSLRKDPSVEAEITGNPLTQGTTLRILESSISEPDSLKWYKVRLNSDYAGWISTEDFEPVSIPEGV